MRLPGWLRPVGGAAALGVVAGIVLAAVLAAAAQAPDASEADLEAASAGRTVRVALGPDRRITNVPIEVYVARVLAGEGEPKAAPAAHEALAVAIRTYAAANPNRHQRDGFDLCATTHCQVVRASSAASRRAALATAGQTLLYQGRPAELFYSASCGGRTEAAGQVWRGMPEYPYLRSVEDHVHADDVPWTLTLTREAIQAAVGKLGVSGSALRSISVEDRSPSGRVATVRLNGLRPPDLSGDDFRMALGPAQLRSTAFAVRKVDTGWEFSGKGYGHGVGMCVVGAGRLAVQGWTAERILDLYYPGLQLTTVVTPPGQGPRRPSPAAPVAPVSVPSPPAAVPAPGASASSPATTTRTSTGSSSPVILDAEADLPDRGAIEGLAHAAYDYLSANLGVSLLPLTLRVHPDVDGFRRVTGRPWWVNHRVEGSVVDVQPPAILAQREGLAFALRVAVADALLRGSLGHRPEWVRVGAARYYGRLAGGATSPVPREPRLICPSDADLLLALSAQTQRDAERRAEACFAQARTRTPDWRDVR